MTDHTYLMVPMKVDALLVEQQPLVAVRRAPDFTRLPYYDPARGVDVNSDTAFLAETILPQPFANADVELGPGLHLHWAMPDSLTRGRFDRDRDEIVFPKLPTRWLISRRMKGAADPDEQWIVESDYLAPPGVNRRGIAIDIPFKAVDEDDAAVQPFRYLGRNMPITAWPAEDGAHLAEGISATGFGDVAFAAYYPSCFSVFGFRDPAPPSNLDKTEYQVIGWYSERRHDPVATLASQSGNQPEQLAQRFEWLVDASGSHEHPDRTLCYATVAFDSSSAKPNRRPQTTEVAVTVANTPGEALSAHLARSLAGDGLDGRARVETQLEALQLATQLDEESLSLTTQVRALRHQTRFAPVEAGVTWRVRVDDLKGGTVGAAQATSAAAAQESEKPRKRTPLSGSVIAALNHLNSLQDEYDNNSRTISDLQRRLFADWYKYMVALAPPDGGKADYPPPDEIRFYIERGDLAAVSALQQVNGRLEVLADDADGATEPTSTLGAGQSEPASVAARLVAGLDELAAEVDDFTKDLESEERDRYRFVIESVPGTRFWQPTNPVVMLSGDGAKPTGRHGQDGKLSCGLHRGTTESPAGRTALLEVADALARPETHGYNNSDAKPWNPVVLEWKAYLYSLKDRVERFVGSERYSHSYVADNYEAPILSPELELRPGRGAVVPDPNIYVGSTIMTAQASDLLRGAVTDRLLMKSPEVDAYFAEQGTEGSEARRRALADPKVVSAILTSLTDRNYSNPTATLLAALVELQNTNVLTQELGGFNEALIQHKSTIELGIDDPVNFDTYRGFSNQAMRDALDGSSRTSPSPQNAFNPIRAGSLKLMQLKLVDTFGQSRSIDVDEITAPTAMTTAGSGNLVRLAPRLAQPARLKFHWLRADSDPTANATIDLTVDPAQRSMAVDQQQGSVTREARSTEQANPICGWVLPNILDRSLAFYDAAGAALGYFVVGDPNAVWRVPPGGSEAETVEQIANPHLRRVAKFVQDAVTKESDPRFVGNFIGVIDDALENIVGSNQQSPQGSAAIMGRPIAVVRAAIDLELMGAPAVDHSWPVFRRDMERSVRTTAEFTKVRFPVRIGEFGQLGDGLIGYWLEAWNEDGSIRFTRSDVDASVSGMAEARFYAPQSDFVDGPSLESRFDAVDDGAINFHQCLDDPPQYLTMLVDPTAKIHATVGVLPRKVVDIPQAQYAEALDNIEVNFQHAPLITPSGRLEIPLRPLPGFEWTWIEERDGGWKELHPLKRIHPDDLVNGWDDADLGIPDGTGYALWQQLTDPKTNWIRLLDVASDEIEQLTASEAAYVLVPAEDAERNPKLGGPFEGKEHLVLELLDRIGIGIDPVATHARFGLGNEIRDGWLKLRRSESKT